MRFSAAQVETLTMLVESMHTTAEQAQVGQQGDSAGRTTPLLLLVAETANHVRRRRSPSHSQAAAHQAVARADLSVNELKACAHAVPLLFSSRDRPFLVASSAVVDAQFPRLNSSS